MNRRGRLLVAGALVAMAGVVLAVAARQRPPADDPEARAAYAEWLVAADARDKTTAQAEEARRLGPAGAAVAGEAERVAREAGEHAERLGAEWGGRWRGLGLSEH